jgi:hypothetical protein
MNGKDKKFVSPWNNPENLELRQRLSESIAQMQHALDLLGDMPVFQLENNLEHLPEAFDVQLIGRVINVSELKASCEVYPDWVNGLEDSQRVFII